MVLNVNRADTCFFNHMVCYSFIDRDRRGKRDSSAGSEEDEDGADKYSKNVRERDRERETDRQTDREGCFFSKRKGKFIRGVRRKRGRWEKTTPQSFCWGVRVDF